MSETREDEEMTTETAAAAEPHACSYAPDGFLEPSGECLNPGHPAPGYPPEALFAAAAVIDLALMASPCYAEFHPDTDVELAQAALDAAMPFLASRSDLAEAAAIGKRFNGFLTAGEREALARLGAAAGGSR